MGNGVIGVLTIVMCVIVGGTVGLLFAHALAYTGDSKTSKERKEERQREKRLKKSEGFEEYVRIKDIILRLEDIEMYAFNVKKVEVLKKIIQKLEEIVSEYERGIEGHQMTLYKYKATFNKIDVSIEKGKGRSMDIQMKMYGMVNEAVDYVHDDIFKGLEDNVLGDLQGELLTLEDLKEQQEEFRKWQESLRGEDSKVEDKEAVEEEKRRVKTRTGEEYTHVASLITINIGERRKKKK